MEFRGPDINPSIFWRAVGTRPVGATIVTAQYAGHRAGFLGLSFSHVSADPPIVLVSANHSTSALATILASKAFAVSLLPGRSEAVARAFGGSVPNEERFAAASWDTLTTGAPVLAGAPVTFDCELHRVINEDQTSMLLGRVVGIGFSSANDVTVAYHGAYRNI